MKYWLLLLLVASCTQSAPPTSTSPARAEVPGVYQGVLPCADCAGIELTLYLYPDSSYLEKQTYLGLPRAQPTVVYTGRWSQPAAALVKLTRRANEGPTDFQVRENGLVQLDLSGQPITGRLAARYRLARLGVW